MATETFGSSTGTLYAAEMATTELLGVEEVRKGLSGRVDLADKTETHTVVTMHGRPSAVIVDMAWYVKARQALGDPTDIRVAPKAEPKAKVETADAE